MTIEEDRIEKANQRVRERPLGEGLREGSPEWWAERAKRHEAPELPAVVHGRIEDFEPPRRPMTEAEIEEYLANLTGEEDVEP